MSDDPLAYRHGGAYVVPEAIEDIYLRWDDVCAPFSVAQVTAFAEQLLEWAPSTEKELNVAINETRKRLKISPRRSQLLQLLSVHMFILL